MAHIVQRTSRSRLTVTKANKQLKQDIETELRRMSL